MSHNLAFAVSILFFFILISCSSPYEKDIKKGKEIMVEAEQKVMLYDRPSLVQDEIDRAKYNIQRFLSEARKRHSLEDYKKIEDTVTADWKILMEKLEYKQKNK